MVLQRFYKILLFLFSIIVSNGLFCQCSVTVDTANIQHIICPNGGSVGTAQILQAPYVNFSWLNTSNGQYYNGVGGNGGTYRNDLDAGLYVIIASNPYGNCPGVNYSDTFEILEAQPDFQFNPTQSCPNACNVSVSVSMSVAISNINYTFQFDNSNIVSLPFIFNNQCGGLHNYQVFADGLACGIENIGVSQFAQMNLATTTTSANCTQGGSATVNITGVGASSLSSYCDSEPQYLDYSTIDNVVLLGDNFSINNPSNVSGLNCSKYTDFTNLIADVSPGNTYSIDYDLGTCHPLGFGLNDISSVYVDWNLDGDFYDNNELIWTSTPTISPSSHTFSFTVPINAIPGQSRLRIVSQYYVASQNNQANACDNNLAYYGETEDYTLQVNGAVATPVTYLWSDGQTNQTASNLTAGTYTVTITDANGCTATDTAVVSGTGSNITVTASVDQNVCFGDLPNQLSSNSTFSGTYSWSPSSYFVNPNVQNPIFNISPNTNTIFTVTFTDNASGCIATDDVEINIIPSPIVVANVLPISPVCAGINITLSGSGTATNYTWNNNVIDGNSFLPPQSSNANSQSTTYVVTGTDNSTGCTGTDNITVVVNPIPSAIISANPNPACLGDDITLTGISSIAVNEYRFMYNDGSGWTNLNTPAWSANNSITYNSITQSTSFRVRVREYNGCSVSSWSPILTVPIVTFSNLSIWHN